MTKKMGPPDGGVQYAVAPIAKTHTFSVFKYKSKF